MSISDRLLFPFVAGLVFLATVFPAAGQVQANSPQLTRVDPQGAQRGTELELNLRGQRLDDPLEVLFYDEAFTVKEIIPEENEERDDRRVRVRVEIAEDARLGEHHVRLRTRRGWTDVQTFWVGDLPVVDARDETSFAEPQQLDKNVTVHGVILNEQVQYFAVEAVEGEKISVEVEAIRMGRSGTRPFDPYVAILNKDRFVLAEADMTALLLQDAFVSMIAPEDGTYVIELRGSAYEGHPSHYYRLHVGSFPRPTGTFPAGGKAGEYVDMTFLGLPGGPSVQQVRLPDEPVGTYGIFFEQDGLRAPSPNWIRVTDFPDFVAEASNHSLADAWPVEKEAPLAFSGVLAQPGQENFYRFQGREGQTIEVQVYARELGSPLDPTVSLFEGDGDHISSNTDNDGSRDSYLSQRLPADGEYVIRIRDHLSRGGEDFFYRIEVTPAQPRLEVFMPRVARRDTQSRQFVSVPRGNRWALLLQARRDNFGGELEFLADQLPDGVTMHAPHMPSNTNQVPIVFEADEDAELDGFVADLRVRNVDNEDIEGGFLQTVEIVRGNPNQTPYYTTTVHGLPVAVTDKAPFSIELVEPKVPLVRDGRIDLQVIVHREEGFEGQVELEIPFRPGQVGASAQIRVPGDQDRATYRLNGRDRAATGDWPIVVAGWAEVDGGQLWVSSHVVNLTVEEQLVAGELDRGAAEQGQQARMLCELEVNRDFEGEATVELMGLPDSITTDPVTITAEDEQIVFNLQVSDETPSRTYRNLFARLTLVQDEEQIVQEFAQGGQIRVDEPREPEPEEEEEEEQEEEEEPEEEEVERPLSRLEQLRKELGRN